MVRKISKAQLARKLEAGAVERARTVRPAPGGQEGVAVLAEAIRDGQREAAMQFKALADALRDMVASGMRPNASRDAVIPETVKELPVLPMSAFEPAAPEAVTVNEVEAVPIAPGRLVLQVARNENDLINEISVSDGQTERKSRITMVRGRDSLIQWVDVIPAGGNDKPYRLKVERDFHNLVESIEAVPLRKRSH